MSSLTRQEMSVNQRFFFVTTKQILFFVVINLIRDKQNILESVMSRRRVVCDESFTTGHYQTISPKKIGFCTLFRFYVPLSMVFYRSSSSGYVFPVAIYVPPATRAREIRKYTSR